MKTNKARYIFCFFMGLAFHCSLTAQEVLQQEMGTYAPFGNFILNNQNLYLSKSVTAEEASEITITENAPQTEYGGGVGDAYFEKRNSNGEVLWNTFFGGEGEDGGRIIGFHQDNLYVLGRTSSTDEITTSGVFQEDFLEYESNNDAPLFNAYLAKLNEANGEKEWATYFRSAASEIIEHITDATVAQDGSVYMVGRTQSEENIATAEAFDGSLGESYLKGFIQKFDSEGNREWGTYYGSANSRDLDVTYINKVVEDHNGDIIISGTFFGVTPESYFVTPDAYNDGQNLANDTFLAKFDADGNRIWGLMYGGVDFEISIDLKVDSENNILFFGSTKSLEDIATPGAHQENLGSSEPINDMDDAFLAKFDPNGQLLWGTYYGGHQADSYGSNGQLGFGIEIGNRTAIALDQDDHIFITAQTKSIDKIATPDVYQDSLTDEDYYDTYIVKFTPDGERLWGTYFGGNGDEKNPGILYAGEDSFYLYGTTQSTTGIATDNAWWDSELPEDESYFLTRFSAQEMGVPSHEKNNFSLYPNPSSGSFVIDGESFAPIDLTVYDLQGRKIESFSQVHLGEVINLKVESGIYFVQIRENHSMQTLKLVVK